MIKSKNISLETTQEYVISEDKNILGYNPGKILNYKTVFNKLNEESPSKYSQYLKKRLYLYNYLPICPNIYNKNKNKKSEIIQQKLFLKYKPIYSYKNYFELLEVLSRFEIIYNIKATSNILSIGEEPSLFEPLIYYGAKTNDNIFVKMNKYIFDTIINVSLDKSDKLEELIQIKTVSFTENIYKLLEVSKHFNIKNSHSLDLIHIDYHRYDSLLGDCNSYMDIYYLVFFVFVIENINTHGNFIIRIMDFTRQFIYDLFLILSEFFDSHHIYRTEVEESNDNNVFLIFKKFKTMTPTLKNMLGSLNDVIKKVSKFYPNDIDDFNVYDEATRGVLNVTKMILDKPKPYLRGLLNLKDMAVDTLYLYSSVQLFNQSYFSRVMHTYNQQLQILNVPLNTLPPLPTSEQINLSILYCRKWDIEYYDYFNDDDLFKNKIGRTILNDLYGLHQPIIYEFKTPQQFYSVQKPSLALNLTKSRSENTSKNKRKSIGIRRRIGSSIGRRSNIKNKLLDLIEESKRSKKARQSGKMSQKRSKGLTLTTQKFKSLNEAMNFYNTKDYIDLITIKLPDTNEQENKPRKKKGQEEAKSVKNVMLRDINEDNNLNFNKSNENYKSRLKKRKSGNKSVVRFNKIKHNFDYYHVGQKKVIKYSLPYFLNKIIKDQYIDIKWTIMFEMLNETDILGHSDMSATPHNYNILLLTKDYLGELDCLKYFMDYYVKHDDFSYLTRNEFKSGQLNFGNTDNIINLNYKYTEFNTQANSPVTKTSGLIINTGAHNEDSFETFKQLFAVLYCLSDNDSMIFKLSLPLDNRPILNLIYLSYYHFKNFIIYKPIQEGYTKDFYIIGKKYRKIDEQLMENMLNIITEIDNNQLDFEDLDLFNDIYPEVYGIQLERINRTLVNKYVGFIDKQIFYYDNYKYINKKIKELSEDYIKEKNLEWLHRYKIKKIKPNN